MKKLLSICTLIGAISLSALSAHAQSIPSTQHERSTQEARSMGRHALREHKFDPAERAAHLQKALQLNDEQTAKIKKLFEDSKQQRKSIADKYKPQFDAFHADMEKLREQTNTQLNSVLTPKQQQALEAQRKAHRGGKRAHGEKDDDNKDDHH